MPKTNRELELVKDRIRAQISTLEKNLQEVRWSDRYHQSDDMYLQGQINGYRSSLILLNNLS